MRRDRSHWPSEHGARIGAVVALGALVVLLGAAVTYVAVSSNLADTPAAAQDVEVEPDRDGLRAVGAPGPILVRAVDPEAPRADGSLYELSPDGSAERVSELACKRVAASPDGAGMCLRVSGNGVDYEAALFGPGYGETGRLPVRGVPDRARMSADGRHGAYTSFDASQSESYFESSRRFSTYTRIVDIAAARERMRVDERLDFYKDGRPLTVGSAELWGVTFAAGRDFYATLDTGDDHYLITGSVGDDEMRALAQDVECPSLSPDRTRIAYKERIDGTNRWRFHVLDLETRRTTELAEPRSIDDQPEWLGDDYVLYSDDRDVYAVSADGSGRPTLLARNATSPISLAPRPGGRTP